MTLPVENTAMISSVPSDLPATAILKAQEGESPEDTFDSLEDICDQMPFRVEVMHSGAEVFMVRTTSFKEAGRVLDEILPKAKLGNDQEF